MSLNQNMFIAFILKYLHFSNTGYTVRFHILINYYRNVVFGDDFYFIWFWKWAIRIVCAMFLQFINFPDTKPGLLLCDKQPTNNGRLSNHRSSIRHVYKATRYWSIGETE